MKRLLSVILTLSLLCSLFVVPADAAVELETGKLGDDITYTFDPVRGRVEISGTGEMWDFDPPDMPAPELDWGSRKIAWESNGQISPLAGNRDVRHIVISDGITRIGSCAFYHCGTQDIAFGNTVSEIGKLAFAGNSISCLQFPASLKRLEELCFYSESAICPVYFLGDAPEFAIPKEISIWPFFANDPMSGNSVLYYTPGAKGWPVENLLMENREPCEQFEMPFSDVAVENGPMFCCLANCDWLQGTGDGRFMPERTATRAELVTALYRMKGSPSPGRGKRFFDVEDGMWYTDAVNWAASEGIVKSYPLSRFCPEDPITYEELATILYRCSGGKKSDLPQITQEEWEQVSDYAQAAVNWAPNYLEYMDDILYKLRYKPQDNLNRLEMAWILNFYENL